MGMVYSSKTHTEYSTPVHPCVLLVPLLVLQFADVMLCAPRFLSMLTAPAALWIQTFRFKSDLLCSISFAPRHRNTRILTPVLWRGEIPNAD